MNRRPPRPRQVETCAANRAAYSSAMIVRSCGHHGDLPDAPAPPHFSRSSTSGLEYPSSNASPTAMRAGRVIPGAATVRGLARERRTSRCPAGPPWGTDRVPRGVPATHTTAAALITRVRARRQGRLSLAAAGTTATGQRTTARRRQRITLPWLANAVPAWCHPQCLSRRAEERIATSSTPSRGHRVVPLHRIRAVSPSDSPNLVVPAGRSSVLADHASPSTKSPSAPVVDPPVPVTSGPLVAASRSARDRPRTTCPPRCATARG